MAGSALVELFAGELRRARSAAGLSQESLGQQISYSGSLIAAVEQGRRLPRPDFTARCDEALRTDGLLGRIREQLSREVLLPWFREWARIEQEATVLRSYQPLVVPGLLQTEEYARALLTGAGRFTDEQAEQLVAARLERQAVLGRPTPPQLVVVLDEFVLRRPVGGPAVMGAQLAHLAEVGRRFHVHLHVVPVAAGAYPGLNGAFVVATTADGEDVAYLDNQLQGHAVSHGPDVLSLLRTWESVRAEALPARASADLIEEAARAWS
ncbi:helix-turn-helix domain-containing protein [Micromonospora siamensis]|uniref:Helix-turn-helix domain-containing protein n=1 Tax=Micromonospora siamensis TaxID=299152 RepID=A0A1C5HE52_9ACTN|nr:helix-turn-helix transcriptional regulator [Micromonospora siamensis]SCG44260.1 Helix-turn-helix domain-containing protein [Micromonospora siamensis]